MFVHKYEDFCQLKWLYVTICSSSHVSIIFVLAMCEQIVTRQKEKCRISLLLDFK